MIEFELLHYGYLFVFLGSIAEGDATLLTAAFLAHRGYMRFAWVLIVAFAGTLIASQLSFEFGRRKGRATLAAYSNAATRIERISQWTSRFGGAFVVASRFLFGFRTLAPVVCGATGMDPLRFTLWNLAGAAIWTITFGAAGYTGAHVLSLLMTDIRQHEKLLAAILAVSVLLLIGRITRGNDWIDFLRLRKPR